MPPSPSSPVHQPSRGQLPQCPQPALQQRRRRRTLQQTQLHSFSDGDLHRRPSKHPRSTTTTITTTATKSRFGTCPMCQQSFSWYKLEQHAADCQGRSEKSNNNNNNNTNNFRRGIASDPNSHADQTTPNEATTTTVNCLASKACTMGSEPMPSPSPVTEGMDDTTIIHPSNRSIHGIESPRQVSEASPKIPSLRLLSWPPPPPATNMIYPQNTMTTGTDQPLPPGLFLYPDYITQGEEQQLLNLLDDPLAVPRWKASRFNGQSNGKRWGVHCNLRDRRVDSPEHALPPILMETIVNHHRWDRLSCWWGNQKSPTVLRPNEANAIDYRKSRGDWLQAHVDDRKLSKEPIANLSLAGHCFMTYRRTGTGTKNSAAAAGSVGTRDVYKVWLPPRCLQILTGPARYNYTHEIAHWDLQSERRVSITLRESPLTTSALFSNTTTTTTTTFVPMGPRKIRTTPKIDTVFIRKQEANKK